MKAADYYRYQSVARGLHTEEDVQALVRNFGPIYDRILEPWLGADRTIRIYEVACGNGIFLRWARARGFTQLAGSDISTAEIERARSAGFDVQAIDSLSVLEEREPNSLDCIVAIDFIEHLPKEVLMEFLHLACQALKPGGRLLLRGPNGDSPFVGCNLYNDITHFWAYTTPALRSLAQMAGFSRIEFKDDTAASIQRHRWLKLPFMLVAQRLLRWWIRAATHEDIECLGASVYACARK